MKITEDYLLRLLADDSFLQWIREGKPKDSIWHEKYSEDSYFREVADQSASLLTHMNNTSDHVSEKHLAKIKDNIDQRIFWNSPTNDVQWHLRKYLKWAAVVVLIAATVFVLDRYAIQKEQVTEAPIEVVKSTVKGQKLVFYLPDGSRVKINANTQLRFDSYFKNTSRTVYLDGEAFFEVEKDPTRPFKVVTGDITTTALGTSFNVNASLDNEVNVTLATGKVVVTRTLNKNEEQHYLNPGQQLVMKPRQAAVLAEVVLKDALAWKDGRIIFHEASRPEVFTKLETWYGVSFRFQEAMTETNWNYNAEFDNESLFNVLTSIGQVKNFDFQIEKDTVLVYPKD